MTDRVKYVITSSKWDDNFEEVGFPRQALELLMSKRNLKIWRDRRASWLHSHAYHVNFLKVNLHLFITWLS